MSIVPVHVDLTEHVKLSVVRLGKLLDLALGAGLLPSKRTLSGQLRYSSREQFQNNKTANVKLIKQVCYDSMHTYYYSLWLETLK